MLSLGIDPVLLVDELSQPKRNQVKSSEIQLHALLFSGWTPTGRVSH